MLHLLYWDDQVSLMDCYCTNIYARVDIFFSVLFGKKKIINQTMFVYSIVYSKIRLIIPNQFSFPKCYLSYTAFLITFQQTNSNNWHFLFPSVFLTRYCAVIIAPTALIKNFLTFKGPKHHYLRCWALALLTLHFRGL